MRTLISLHPQTHFLLKFSSISTQNRNPSLFLHNRCFFNLQEPISSYVTVSCSANSTAGYNGWDDLRIRIDSDELGESNQLKKFLVLLGIDDKKYLFTCVLGFFCALAISRVRVSSLVVFPAAAIVFAVGFSFGFVNGRPQKGLGLNGSKRRAKDESLRLHVEKLKNLVNLFDGFDVQVSELQNDIKQAIDHERVEVGDLEGYVDAVESIGGLVLNARNVIQDYIDSVSGEGQGADKNLIQNQNKKRKEIGESGFNLFEYAGSFLRDYALGSKSSKIRTAKKVGVAKGVNDRVQEKLRGPAGERGVNPVATKHHSHTIRESSSNVDGMSKSGERDREVERILQRAKMNKMNTMGRYINTETSVDTSWYDFQTIRFRNNRQVNLNMSVYREIRKWAPNESIRNNTDFDISKRQMESDTATTYQQILQNPNGAYESSGGRENVDYENYRASFGAKRTHVEDELHSKKYQSQQENDLGSFSSSMVSDDILFDKCLSKADDLLKQAKQCLKDKNDELAEEMLHESAKLLSQAIAMKPMSLLAIGQLGNTYLLHGELKLRISRQLRRLLSRSDDFGTGRQSSSLEDALPNRDRIATLLVNVCEECEELLVEAGRKYRTALAIDGNDLRALYNWGLALSFRAQLIADIGPEAALDADQLFLAAIDKFDAMMSRSNVHAPEALFRWGVALQKRSRLRPSNSRDKVKLLQQAKRLYEDALDMGSENHQVREALSSCISELDFSDL
uniref:Uncharacterized protein n=1 Tax=Opuntia streptacantha TaxID=393608 RepID=A0A7C9APE5_OPUST